MARTSSGRAVEVESRGANQGLIPLGGGEEMEPLKRSRSGRGIIGEDRRLIEICPHLAAVDWSLKYKCSKLKGDVNSCKHPGCGNPLFNWVCLCCKEVHCSNDHSPFSHSRSNPSCGIELNLVTLKPHCRHCARAVGDREHPEEAELIRPAMEVIKMPNLSPSLRLCLNLTLNCDGGNPHVQIWSY